jgi:hypothetical protein
VDQWTSWTCLLYPEVPTCAHVDHHLYRSVGRKKIGSGRQRTIKHSCTAARSDSAAAGYETTRHTALPTAPSRVNAESQRARLCKKAHILPGQTIRWKGIVMNMLLLAHVRVNQTHRHTHNRLVCPCSTHHNPNNCCANLNHCRILLPVPTHGCVYHAQVHTTYIPTLHRTAYQAPRYSMQTDPISDTSHPCNTGTKQHLS